MGSVVRILLGNAASSQVSGSRGFRTNDPRTPLRPPPDVMGGGRSAMSLGTNRSLGAYGNTNTDSWQQTASAAGAVHVTVR